MGASPTRQPLQPEAIGAVMEVTKWLKPSISVSRIGDSASVQAATRVNAEQALYGAFEVKHIFYTTLYFLHSSFFVRLGIPFLRPDPHVLRPTRAGASKRTMRRSTRQPYRGRLIRLDENERSDTFRRCAGVVAAACTQGKRTKHGKPQGMVSDDQPDAREGQAGRPGVAERS